VKEFDSHQYGFCKGKSAEDCINKVLSEIRILRDKRRYVAVVSLDIHGAFDHVYHEEAIKAMRNRGVPQYITGIMTDYFKGRRVSVESKSMSMNRGCPQGSVLGPTIWNLIYDTVLKLLKELGIIAYAFADDTLLLVPADSREELDTKVKTAVDVLIEKFNELGLTLNFDKTI